MDHGPKGVALAIVFLAVSLLVCSAWMGYVAVYKVVPALQAKPAPQKSGDLVSLAEAAAFLGINEGQVQSLMKTSVYVDGKGIPYFNIGDQAFFSKAALSEWIARSSENHLTY